MEPAEVTGRCIAAGSRRHPDLPSLAEWTDREVWVPPAPAPVHVSHHLHGRLPTVDEWTDRDVPVVQQPEGAGS
jgi:hypothetical protein